MGALPTLVIKVGGNEMDDPGFTSRLGPLIAGLPARPVVVHGGGKGTTALLDRLGLSSRFVDGLRVTDDEALEAAIMGLVGTASTRLVAALVDAGVPALGLCGVDARLVTVQKMREDLGWVGRPTAVHVKHLRALLEAGFVPCVAPISRGADGHLYNVNADHVAAAVAAHLEADTLVFLTAVPGVLTGGHVVSRLSPIEIEDLIAQGVIQGGMIPKVRSAVEALESGVRQVLITDLEGLSNGLGTHIASVVGV